VLCPARPRGSNHYYLIDDRGQLKHLYTTDTGGDFRAALKAE
jgi:hypothetical protein